MTQLEIESLRLVGSLIVGVAIATVSAYLAVRWSLKRFATEKLWERKSDAYTSILGTLHEMKRYPDRYMDREIKGREISEDEKNVLWDEYKKAHSAVRKQADIGTLIISQEAVEALSLLEKELEAAASANSIFEHVDTQLYALNKCLNDVRKAALTDLRIKQ